ncbi:aminomethyl-transferring glycine dehydrogenase subunit GcvPA [Candidatus Albibeggiatoa sp. nov. NOAA]|uniref:aminomethyl-transferring glycine dehydrogenase subunit GcvPA n=1 Tax=Candidatus Albibeggiatoa sp. nov. NOAA TaxID=3162724 RepID=UPI0032FE6EAE|nr:aminomethyl-transferring glycine dehydrogenase subunit GcvPA [Thiotrichaceae bacterium]
MPYIPHTPQDIDEMLAQIKVNSIEDLFDEIPAELRCGTLENVPEALTELEVTQLMQQRANQDKPLVCFAGAGAYEHHIPAAVWEIATRGEFYSAYTPYQAEASQGTLQLLYEYQSMMARLTGMDVSNASLYDGASALAEAVLMAVRQTRGKNKKILIPQTVHPRYKKVVETTVKNQQIELVSVEYDKNSGTLKTDNLPTDAAALVIAQPNFFGNLEDVDTLTNWAHEHKMLVIAAVNPLSLAILTPPGLWGDKGADIACGEGQPLGIPLSYGGPYFGFICCKKPYVRQMPGRIVGRTVDLDGKQGFTLTLQAREQHIRRSKATSNICTNQGLMVTAATVHTALMGAKGLEQTAATCHANTVQLRDKLVAIDGVEQVFESSFFHEVLLKLNKPVDQVVEALADNGILGGYAVGQLIPELDDCLLICATETRTQADIDLYAEQLANVLNTL